MDGRIAATTKKVGRIIVLAGVLAVAGQVVLPAVAHASRRPHCAAVPVPGKPGTYVVRCSTGRP
jgi:hypothetical protein